MIYSFAKKYITYLSIFLVILISKVDIKAQSIQYSEISPSGATISRFAWNPTSQYMAVSSNTNVSIYSKNLDLIVNLPTNHTDMVLGLTWSPDSNFLATAGLDGNIHIWNTSDLPSVTLDKTLSHGKPIWSISWGKVTNDNQLLSVVSEDFQRSSDASIALSTINIWDVTTTTIVDSSAIQFQGAINAEWSYDGRYIAYPNYTLEEDFNVLVWDTVVNEEIAISGNAVEINDISWNATNNTFAFADSINFVSFIDFTDIYSYNRGETFKSVIDFELYSLDWSHITDFIVASGTTNTLALWDIQSGEQTAMTFEPHPTAVVQVAWSPDDRYIGSVDLKGNLRVWNVSSLTQQCDTNVVTGDTLP